MIEFPRFISEKFLDRPNYFSEDEFLKAMEVMGYNLSLEIHPALNIAKRAHNGSYMYRSQKPFLEEHIFSVVLNYSYHYWKACEVFPRVRDNQVMILHDSREDYHDRNSMSGGDLFVRNPSIGFYNEREEVDEDILANCGQEVFDEVDVFTDKSKTPYDDLLDNLCRLSDIPKFKDSELLNKKLVDRLVSMRSGVNYNNLRELIIRAKVFAQYLEHPQVFPSLRESFIVELENLQSLT